MRQQIQKFNPLDIQTTVGVGVKLPFESPSVFTITYTTAEALKSNLINYFLTGTGERFLNPTFGAGLRNLIFQQGTVDVEDEIRDTVKAGLKAFFPNIAINKLTTQLFEDTNTFLMTLNYSVINTNIQDQVTINFEQ